MVSKSFTIVIVAISLLYLSGCGDESNPALGATGDGGLESQLDTIRKKYRIPALAALIVNDQGVLESTAVGLRSQSSNVEVSLDDYWHIGSITKSMTATLAAFLVDEGLIRWDTTIQEVFPEKVESILPKYRELELQQFLSMSSGLNDELSESILEKVESGLIDLDDQTGSQRVQNAALLLEYDRGLPVGEYFYTNINYVLASSMLEKVTGQDWRNLLQDKVFSQLNISEFGFGIPGTRGLLDQPLGHERINDEYQGVFADNPPLFDPSGRVHISLSGMAKYAMFHLKGMKGEGKLLKAETYAALYRSRVSTEKNNNEEGYALGWLIEDGDASHNGSNTYWLAELGFSIEDNVAIFVVTNTPPDEAAFDTVFESIRLLQSRLNNLKNTK